VAPGPSGALRTGFAVAQAPYILVTMADLCDDHSQIKTFLDLVPEKADIVCPSRYCRDGHQYLKTIKKYIPLTAGYLLKIFARLQTVDPTNSYKFYSTEIIRNLNLTSTSSFAVTLEIIAKAHCLGYRIIEIPTVWRDRQAGKSNFKVGISTVTYTPWFFVALLGSPLFHFLKKKKWQWFGNPAKRFGSLEKEKVTST